MKSRRTLMALTTTPIAVMFSFAAVNVRATAVDPPLCMEPIEGESGCAKGKGGGSGGTSSTQRPGEYTEPTLFCEFNPDGKNTGDCAEPEPSSNTRAPVGPTTTESPIVTQPPETTASASETTSAEPPAGDGSEHEPPLQVLDG
jgi:hypothetical protein